MSSGPVSSPTIDPKNVLVRLWPPWGVSGADTKSACNVCLVPLPQRLHHWAGLCVHSGDRLQRRASRQHHALQGGSLRWAAGVGPQSPSESEKSWQCLVYARLWKRSSRGLLGPLQCCWLWALAFPMLSFLAFRARRRDAFCRAYLAFSTHARQELSLLPCVLHTFHLSCFSLVSTVDFALKSCVR